MIYQSGFGRSRLPEANCLLLKKGCRQAFLVQGRLAKTKTDNIYWSYLGVLQQSGEQRSLCECEQRQREQQQ